ncbi:MAG TPA: TonB family protein [Longimicrobiaceae bacterium]|nr:TonB family protein [Longimicrobiaceae bacterium]
MFSNLTSGRRKRRFWSPATVAASVGAHVLLLGGVLLASGGEPRREVVDILPIGPYVPEVPEPPREPELAVPEPMRPEAPSAPKTGDYVQPTPPEDIPKGLPDYSPADRPLTPADVDGIGRVRGDVVGPVDPADDRPPTGATGPVVSGGEVYDVGAVAERPALANAAEMQRVLQRLYPTLLREAGIAGQTQLQLVIDAQGRVEPGSVTVVSTTHEGFSDASVKAAERFRFRPAKVGGRGVRVMITLPITWTLER